MVALISFFFLLFFSALFAILFSYFILEDENDNLNVVLITILASSIAFILGQSIDSSNSALTYALGLMMIVYLSNNFLKSTSKTQMILLIFPGIIGMLIGFGFIFEVIILMIFLYVIRTSFREMYNVSKNYDGEDEVVENSDN